MKAERGPKEEEEVDFVVGKGLVDGYRKGMAADTVVEHY